ncbi:hypothetical protein D3C76_638500 [compost metagenome]
MLLDDWIPGQVGIAHQCTDQHSAIRGGLDAVQAKAGDVDQAVGANHVFLHQVDEVGTTGNEARGGVCQADSFADRCGLVITEWRHGFVPPCGWATSFINGMASSTAATMLP